MLTKNISFLLLFISLYSSGINCQNSVNYINKDSLARINISLLAKTFEDTLPSNPEVARVYAEVMLDIFKKSGTNARIATGYRFFAKLYHNDLQKQIIYLDSAIDYGKNVNYKYYPTLIQINKGAAYAVHGYFNKALDTYIDGLKSAKRKKDTLHEYVLYHNIALLKRRLGKYEEAKELFKKCVKYEQSKIVDHENDSISYLVSLNELAITYRRNLEIDSSLYLTNNGLKTSKKEEVFSLFQLNKGIIEYHRKNYEASGRLLLESLLTLQRTENKYFVENYNLIDGYFYLGKTYEKKNNKEKAIIYYKKVDSLITSTNYLIPEIRYSYKAIINHYKKRGEIQPQLYYINRLIKYDSILDTKLVDLNIRMSLDYDTPNLVEQKELLIKELSKDKEQSLYLLWIVVFIALVIFVLFLFNYNKQKKYKSRFDALMKEKEVVKEEKIIVPNTNEENLDISEEQIQRILDGLQQFEQQKEFTKLNITSSQVAKNLKTNSKYLTKVIKFYKQKNFTTYINDLRIEYIINELKIDKRLRNYTIKSIAKEAGFNSAEVFSKYFYKKTGIYPSYFVKTIQKSDD